MSTVESALEFHQYEIPTPEAMARYVGFDDEQIAMLGRFWDPVFNKSWFYMDDDTILKYMTKSAKQNGLKRFFKKLKSEYVVDVDYREIKSDDELVSKYSARIGCSQRETRGGKKYYVVSGECLKMLLQSSRTAAGKDVRKYFVRVEELAHFQHQYIAALEKHMAETRIETQAAIMQAQDREHQLEMEAKDRELELAKAKIKIVDLGEYIMNVRTVECVSAIYIVSCPSMARRGIYKIGSVRVYSLRRFKSRLSTYNVGRAHDDMYEFNYIRPTYAAWELDTQLRRLLAQFKHNKRRETVCMDFEAVRRVVDFVVQCNDQKHEFLNAYLENDHLEFMHRKTEPPAVDLAIEFNQIPEVLWDTKPKRKAILEHLIGERTEIHWHSFFSEIERHVGGEPRKLPWKTALAEIAKTREGLAVRWVKRA